MAGPRSAWLLKNLTLVNVSWLFSVKKKIMPPPDEAVQFSIEVFSISS